MKTPQHVFCSMLIVLLSMCSCGRKQKNIFSFGDQDLPRINKLVLPAVRGVTAEKKQNGTLVTWFALDLPTTPVPTTPYLCAKYFAGYNVYRLVRTNIIPKHPCNKKPLKVTTFFDKKIPKNITHVYYLVRAVFVYNKASTEGPTSLIVQLKNLEN